MVRSLALALAARDGYSGEHSDAVEALAVAVAGRLGLDPRQVADVQSAALLHGIGKLGVPDRVLHKPGRLDEAEWALMHQHPAAGERILRPLPGFESVATAVRHAHESWDGRGYPDGLAGEAIPLASRIVLACDAWHALVSDRPYRGALPIAEARVELERCAGTQFDPRVVAALLASLDAPAEAGAPPVLALPGHAPGAEGRAPAAEPRAARADVAVVRRGRHELARRAPRPRRRGGLNALGATSVSSRAGRRRPRCCAPWSTPACYRGRGPPPERRDLPARRRRPAQAAAGRRPLLRRRRRRPRPAPDRAGCSNGSAGGRAWRCR